MLVQLLEGAVVGFGAILPGVSGGTLCAAFGMYRPLIEVCANPGKGLKEHWRKLGIFLLGAGIGFVGLSGLAGALLEKNAPILTCVFIGLILGTLPALWHDAGEQGRGKRAYLFAGCGFLAMLLILSLLKHQSSLTLAPGIPGYLLCGVLWGLSFIVPGLSSSSLLLLFGLYQPMLEGISQLALHVLIPMGIGMAACILLLAKGIRTAFEKQYCAVSHCVIGIVAATMVMIFPAEGIGAENILPCMISIIGGAAASYGFTKVCDKLNDSLFSVG